MSKIQNFVLDWHPNTVKPWQEGDYILYNRCDGFHIVESSIDEDGEVCGFHFFGGEPADTDFYQAWALLPATAWLYRKFVHCEENQ